MANGLLDTPAPVTDPVKTTMAGLPPVETVAPVPPVTTEGTPQPDPSTVLPAPTPRTITGNETVRGQVEGILSEGSPLLTRARTQAQEVANQRGLLNTSMAVQAGETAVIDKALDIARPDAQTYANAGLSAQEAGYQRDLSTQQFGQNIAEITHKGDVSTDISAVEHVQNLEKITADFAGRSGLSTQDATQKMNLMVREFALKNGLSEEDAAREIRRMEAAGDIESIRAMEETLAKESLARAQSGFDMTVNDAKSAWDVTIQEMINNNRWDVAELQENAQKTRTAWELANRQLLEQMSLSSLELRSTMSLSEGFGQQYQSEVGRIVVDPNMTEDQKKTALANALDSYQTLLTTSAAIAGIDIGWHTDGSADILPQDPEDPMNPDPPPGVDPSPAVAPTPTPTPAPTTYDDVRDNPDSSSYRPSTQNGGTVDSATYAPYPGGDGYYYTWDEWNGFAERRT